MLPLRRSGFLGSNLALPGMLCTFLDIKALPWLYELHRGCQWLTPTAHCIVPGASPGVFPTRIAQCAVPSNIKARLNCTLYSYSHQQATLDCAFHSYSHQQATMDCALHSSSHHHFSLATGIVQCADPADSPSPLKVRIMQSFPIVA